MTITIKVQQGAHDEICWQNLRRQMSGLLVQSEEAPGGGEVMVRT